jgi:hypothetical protein
VVGGILRDENLNSGTHDKAVVPTDLELTDALDEQRASAGPASRQPLRQANAEPSSLALAREEDQRSPLALAALLLTDCYGGVITEAAAPWIQLGLSETTRFRSTPTNGP